MWKGPIVAAAAGEDDDDGAKGESGATFFSLLKDFCGSTTAHGAPRAFEEGNGKVRSGAWMIFFLAGLGMLIYQVWGSIAEFASAGTSSTVAFARLQGQPVALPQVTVCHTSPVKCRCSAWYEDGRFYAEGACPAENAGDESCRRFYSEKLPFVCKENLRTCKTCSSVDYPFLDGTAARKAAAGFVDTEQCGTPELQAKFGFDSKTPSKLDLYQYAGYSDRSELVVECHSEGLLGGEDGSDDCSPNKYWDPVWYDHGYGACHTFNGESVTASYDDAGVCSGPACNLVQSRPGGHVHGSGMTLVLDVNVDQATPIFSADSSVHSPHLVVHVHDAKTKGLVNKGFRIYPGDETDVRLRIKEVQMSDMYPFTNCTMDPNAIEPELCETECIQKTIAERCCDSSIDPLAGLTTDRIASDPMLVCPLGVTEEVEQCIRQVKRDSHNGQVCKHPENLSTARGDRFGWYDATSEAQKKLVEEKVLAGESRLYCPSLCNKQTFEPVYTTSGTSLTEGAALAIASQLVYEKPAKVEKMTKQTGCAESPDECIALTVSYVKKNFAVVHVLYDSFEIETVQITPAMSAFSLFGAIGGNLGMWVGVSMMTILESMEWLLVAAAAGLCCVGCCAAKRRPSSSDNMPPSELRSATIMYAQPPAMVHPPLPMGSVRGVSTSSQFGV